MKTSEDEDEGRSRHQLHQHLDIYRPTMTFDGDVI